VAGYYFKKFVTTATRRVSPPTSATKSANNGQAKIRFVKIVVVNLAGRRLYSQSRSAVPGTNGHDAIRIDRRGAVLFLYSARRWLARQ
jgi:hypothetical protein